MLNSTKFIKRTFILFLLMAVFSYGIIFSFGSGGHCNRCNCGTTAEDTTAKTIKSGNESRKEKVTEKGSVVSTLPETTRSDNYTYGLVYDIKQSKNEFYLSVSSFLPEETCKKIVVPEAITVTIPSDYMQNEEYYINHKTENFIITKDVKLTPGETYTLKVRKIGVMAFSNNKTIEEIKIPDSVTMIELFAFSECTNLKKINIPKSLKTIESSAFEACNNLKKISYKGNVNNLSKIEIGDDNKPIQQLIKSTIKEATTKPAKTTVKPKETTTKTKKETK